MTPAEFRHSFSSRADSAAFWEAWVGSVLARAGLYTVHHPFVVDYQDYHGQTWDLDVSNKDPFRFKVSDHLKVRSVEVKSLSLKFDNVSSYQYQTVLLCSQNSFLRKWPGKADTQRDFLLVSTDTGTVLWVPKHTPATFGVEVLDKSRNELYKVVTVDKGQLRPFQDFVEHVKET